jgi:predicted TIM-barrel fold metal-dependent hydrolase
MTEPTAILGVQHRTPDRPTPPGGCDCHVHVFGPTADYPWAADRTYTPPDAPLTALRALHRRLGIERVVIVQPSPYGIDNRCTMDAVRALNADGADRARAVVVVDPDVDDATLRVLHRDGARGVRLNFETAGIHDPRAAAPALARLAERIAPLGWHVQTYTNLAMIRALAPTIRALPVPLVIDHFGRPRAADGVGQDGFDVLLDLVARGAAWVKLSAPYRISRMDDYADGAAFARAIAGANPDRIVWGTDWPHPGGNPDSRKGRDAIEPFRAEDDGSALVRIRRWLADDALVTRMLVDNAARLYGFGR